MLAPLTFFHFAVDGLCAAELFGNTPINDLSEIIFAFMLYNLIAFGGQIPTGMVHDKFPAFSKIALFLPVPVLIAGCFSWEKLWLNGLLLGIGNCLFHSAAGSAILLRYRDFSQPGIFVSSGTIGVALGSLTESGSIPFLILCMVAFFWSWFASKKIPKSVTESYNLKPANDCRLRNFLIGICCAFLLLLCVVLRGFTINAPEREYFLFFAFAVSFGKAIGGILCDRIGYKHTILGIFLLGTATTLLVGLIPELIMVIVFNMTMPLTLRTLHHFFPTRPGLMFGLAAASLLPGAFFYPIQTIPVAAMLVLQFLALWCSGFLLFPLLHNAPATMRKSSHILALEE